MTAEHLCPFCRVNLMQMNHLQDCVPGQSFGGQTQRLSLLVDGLWETLKIEAGRSWMSRVMFWLTEKVYR